jgi:hypothetical protein
LSTLYSVLVLVAIVHPHTSNSRHGPAATRPWIVGGKELGGLTETQTTWPSALHSFSLSLSTCSPPCRSDKDSSNTLATCQARVSEAARWVKNQWDSFMWVSGFPSSIHPVSLLTTYSRQRHDIVSGGEQDRPFYPFYTIPIGLRHAIGRSSLPPVDEEHWYMAEYTPPVVFDLGTTYELGGISIHWPTPLNSDGIPEPAHDRIYPK